ncbi:unnamed protein product [Heterobilharzia americana]|nr:unnamed protein product [Heterobilharzia americana]
MASEPSSHQLVGYVTKMYPTFGYINNEIFFQRKCVIGPMVEVGDNVAASAVYQPHMPIKWSAEKVWRVEERRGRSREKGEESSFRKGQSPRKISPCDNYSKSHERDSQLVSTDQRRVDKKRTHITDRDGDRSLKKSPIRERRRSMDLVHHSSPGSDVYSRTPISSKRMLNVKEFLFSDLQRRFPNILPPVDLYRVRCCWQESFPLLKPFQPQYSTTYQIIKETDAGEICKQLIGLDLSFCTQWHRFLEFRYSRTEGSTAQPTSILFPGSQLWGRPFTESSTDDMIPPSKPFHQITVYFIPNIWSLMPTDEEWPVIKSAYENVLSSKEPSMFPMSASDLKKFSGLESTSKEKGDRQSKVTDEVNSNSLKSPIHDNPIEDPNLPKMDEGIKPISPTPIDDVYATLHPLTDQEFVLKTASVSEAEDGCEAVDLKNTSAQGNQFQEGSDKGQKKLHNELNLANMKVSELREQLKARDLPTEGVKAQLLARLRSAIQEEEEEEESAKKAEKQKEELAKVSQETSEKSFQHSDKQAKPATDVDMGSKPKIEAPKPILRDIPSIIILRKQNVDFSIQSVGLDVVMDSKSGFMDSRSYELMFCVHTIFDMLRRDSVFTLFRALVTAADRGICAKPRKRSEPDYAAKRARLERGDRTSVTKDDECKEVPLYTNDLPLLFACTILDTSYKSYFLSSEVEDFILSLGLPISRYQLRSLIYKVLDHANKSSVIFSDIDDDEYLLELVRGGDAILEDQTDVPSGSIIVLQKLDGTDVSQVANPEEFFQQVRTSEREHQKLMGQIRLQEQEIARLRTSVADFIEIKDKLSKAVLSMEDYRRRYRDERDRVDSMARVLDQQASVLDACRSALRQTSSRIHNRHLTSESSKQSFKRSSSPCSVASNRDLVKPYKKTKTPNPSRIASDSFNDENSAHSCHDVDAPKDTKGEKEKAETIVSKSSSLIAGVDSNIQENLVNGLKSEEDLVACANNENISEASEGKLAPVLMETESSVTA